MKTKIINIGAITTWSSEKNQLQTIHDVEIMIENDKISYIGSEAKGADNAIDADGTLITPGFVDSHTHPVFIGNRSEEFSQRIHGKSYEEIANSGGGIISSIQNIRNVNEDQLFEETLRRIIYFLNHGTTTIEAKSGYGLTTEDELKSLRVIKRLNEFCEIDIIPTFMGAHDFPPEFRDNPDEYVDLLCYEMIPAIAKEKLAEYCDVFCENGYFSIEDSRRILITAQKHGIKSRLHADEFEDSDAAKLAAELRAISADHLMAVSDSGIQALADKGVIATLLPGTTFFLGKSNYAQGRKMIDMGCDVAIATDFNPGSCTIQSMPYIISLACLYCGLSIEEAFIAATWNGARALNREKDIGAVCEGYQADLLFWELNEINEIPYWMGSDRIFNVMKKGKLVGKEY